MTILPGHKEVSVRMRPMHKGRQEKERSQGEQRLQVDGKREKSLKVSFGPLVPATPEAVSTTQLFNDMVQYILFCYLVISHL